MTSPDIRTTCGGLRTSSELPMPGPVNYVPAGTRRLDGPALPPGGRPDTVAGLEKLNERLERLAFGRRPEGHDAPPLETYTTTPTEHGDVVRATPEYVRWFHRTYPAAGPEDRARVPAPGPSAEGVGGKKSPLDKFKSP